MNNSNFTVINNDSSILRAHIPCDHCGSSDAASEYSDSHLYCFSCHTYTPPLKEKQHAITSIATEAYPMEDRGISSRVVSKYQVKANGYPRIFPQFKDGRHVSNKFRYANKGFSWEGETDKIELFGQHLFPAGSTREITITEGYEDAMSVYQMQGERYPVVSIHSAATAHKDVANNFKYLSSFERIVVCFDKDDPIVSPNGDVHLPGQEAAQKVAQMFPIGKVRLLTLEKHKDANEYLLAGEDKQFIKEWWSAPSYTPTGLKFGKDLWDELCTEDKYETVSYPWAVLNDKTYGIRLSELVIFTGDTGIGKSQVLKEILYHILKNTPSGIGLLFLEETNKKTGLDIMSLEADKPLHLPDIREQIDQDTFRKLYDETVNSERLVFFDHFGSNDIGEVLSKVRHMHALGCKYIFLDHLSIIVSNQEGDERKQLDEITTKLKMLCMELNIAVLAVIHINRKGEIRGTAGVEQLANMVIMIERNKEDTDDWRRNINKLVIKKNRFCGRTGPASYLFYEPDTGRLMELNKEDVEKFEAGFAPGTAYNWKPLEETWNVRTETAIRST